MNTKNFEDHRWRHRDASAGFAHKAVLSMGTNGTYLDLGCGDGLLLDMLKYKSTRSVGVDLSQEAINKCKGKGYEAELLDLSVDKLPFPDRSFDYVTMLDILEHFYIPGEVLKEAVRVAGKAVIISVPNFNSLPARVQMMFGRVPENNGPSKGHVFWFNYNNLRKMLAKNNLKISECRMNTFWEKLPVVGPTMRALLIKFPGLFALSFVVKAEV